MKFTSIAETQPILCKKQEKEYTIVNGVGGYRFTASNVNSIFLPFSDTCVGEEVSGEPMATMKGEN